MKVIFFTIKCDQLVERFPLKKIFIALLHLILFLLATYWMYYFQENYIMNKYHYLEAE